jgi:hypothetical protein
MAASASSTGKAGMSLSRSISVGVGPTMSSAWQ